MGGTVQIFMNANKRIKVFFKAFTKTTKRFQILPKVPIRAGTCLISTPGTKIELLNSTICGNLIYGDFAPYYLPSLLCIHSLFDLQILPLANDCEEKAS